MIKFIDFVYKIVEKHRLYLYIAVFLFPSFILAIFTTIFNGIVCLSLQMILSGIIKIIILEKYGLQRIQLEKYRHDIDIVKLKRHSITLTVGCICGLIVYIILYNSNASYWITRL